MLNRLICIMLCCFIWTGASLAKTPERRMADTLRALPGVYFVVEELAQDLQADGLTTVQIRNDVELKLRQAGIRLLTEAEWASTPGKPFLYIRVSALKQGQRYAFHLKMELFQQVRLERYRAIPPVEAPTWAALEEIGLVDTHRIQELRSYVAEQLDQFISDYLALNMV